MYTNNLFEFIISFFLTTGQVVLSSTCVYVSLVLGDIVIPLRYLLSYPRFVLTYFQVMYDTAQSTTPFGLCNHIAHLLATPPERLVLAKHKFESFQWIRIEDSQPQVLRQQARYFLFIL